MAQQVEVLAAQLEDLSLIPSIHKKSWGWLRTPVTPALREAQTGLLGLLGHLV